MPWWEATLPPYIAVLCAEGVLRGMQILPLPGSVAELGGAAEELGLSQVFIHESALAPLGFPPTLGDSRQGGVSHPWLENCGGWTGSKGGTLAHDAKWWRKGGPSGFTLEVPAWASDGSPLAGMESGFQLLCAVGWYEDATRGKAPWRGTGGITSDTLLRSIYANRRRVDLDVTSRPPPMNRARESRYFWHRPPLPAEAPLPYCHALDVNWAYPTAASSLQLPVGEPEHLEFPVTFDKKLPGLWLIDPGPWTDPRLPAPWGDEARRAEPDGPYWVTTPTMERADQLGLYPIEAWVWPTHHAYLRPWYEVIRGARDALPDFGGGWPEGGGPLEAVKALGRRGIGRLAGGRTKAPDADEVFQPYWSWAVIAECRARLHRRFSALETPPVAIDTDCAWILSARPSPELLAVRAGLPLGGGMGQFKAVGTCSGDDAREALAHPNAIVRLRRLTK